MKRKVDNSDTEPGAKRCCGEKYQEDSKVGEQNDDEQNDSEQDDDEQDDEEQNDDEQNDDEQNDDEQHGEQERVCQLVELFRQCLENHRQKPRLKRSMRKLFAAGKFTEMVTEIEKLPRSTHFNRLHMTTKQTALYQLRNILYNAELSKKVKLVLCGGPGVGALAQFFLLVKDELEDKRTAIYFVIQAGLPQLAQRFLDSGFDMYWIDICKALSQGYDDLFLRMLQEDSVRALLQEEEHKYEVRSILADLVNRGSEDLFLAFLHVWKPARYVYATEGQHGPFPARWLHLMLDVHPLQVDPEEVNFMWRLFSESHWYVLFLHGAWGLSILQNTQLPQQAQTARMFVKLRAQLAQMFPTVLLHDLRSLVLSYVHVEWESMNLQKILVNETW
jgi:hypothetical protein